MDAERTDMQLVSIHTLPVDSFDTRSWGGQS